MEKSAVNVAASRGQKSNKSATRSLILRHLKVWLLCIILYMRRDFFDATWKHAQKKLVLSLFLFICTGVRKYFLHVSHELWLWFIPLTCLHINEVSLLSGSSRLEEFVLFSKCNRTFDPRHKSFTGTILV